MPEHKQPEDFAPSQKTSKDLEAPPPPPEPPKFLRFKRSMNTKETHQLALASSVGLAFVIAIFMGLALGWWLDKKLGTSPWLLLLGLIVGIVAGFKNLFIITGKLEKQRQKTDDAFKSIKPIHKPKNKTSANNPAPDDWDNDDWDKDDWDKDDWDDDDRGKK